MLWLAIGVLILVLLFSLVVLRGAPYVPSLGKTLAPAFLELYRLGPSDVLVDVGSGDGVVLRHASRLGAQAVGYEINPILVLVSRLLSWGDPRVRVVFTDFWFSKLPADTTVVYVFTVTRDVAKMVRFLQQEVNRIGHPISVISLGFELNGVDLTARHGAHNLYLLKPLQTNQAQV